MFGSIVGGLIGGLTGGKGQKSTSSTTPVLPENVKKAYDLLIDRSSALSSEPYQDIVRTRVAPSNMYGGLFDNPELMAIQQASDQKYFDSMRAPQSDASATVNPNMQNQMYGQMFANSITNPTAKRSMTSFTPADYEKLGELAYKNNLKVADSGIYAGGITKDGRMPAPDLNDQLWTLLNKYSRG